MNREMAPAKINLSLAITGRRKDGFHTLRTVFQTIDIQDELTWDSGPETNLKFKIIGPDLGPLEQNLIVKAANAFKQKVGPGVPLRGTLTLKKNIPHGGGLGGGSSDAAATLILLNRITNHPLKESELHQIALELGSDVPFFLKKGTALGSGRGEVLNTIAPPDDIPHGGFLLIPEFGCNTARVYRTFAEGHPPEWHHVEEAEPAWGFNDLEEPAGLAYPKVRIMGETIRNQASELSFLTGSGSTWVLLTDSEKAPSFAFPFAVKTVPFSFLSF